MVVPTRRGCYWLVSRLRPGRHETSYNAQDGPTAKNGLAPNIGRAEVGEPHLVTLLRTWGLWGNALSLSLLPPHLSPPSSRFPQIPLLPLTSAERDSSLHLPTEHPLSWPETCCLLVSTGPHGEERPPSPKGLPRTIPQKRPRVNQEGAARLAVL